MIRIRIWARAAFRTLDQRRWLIPDKHVHIRILIVPRIDLDEVEAYRHRVVGDRTQIKRLAHESAATEHASAAENLAEAIAAARPKLDVARPATDAVVKALEKALPTQDVRVPDAAIQRRVHRNHLDVVHAKRLVRRARVQARLEAKRRTRRRVAHHQLNEVVNLHPAAIVAAALRDTTKRPAAVDTAPHLDIIHKQLRSLVIPGVNLDEIERDRELVVLHCLQIECLLQIIASTGNDVVASEDRAKRATLRRTCGRAVRKRPVVRRPLESIQVSKHLQDQSHVVDSEALVVRILVQSRLHAQRQRVRVVRHLERSHLQLLIQPLRVVAVATNVAALIVDEDLTPHYCTVNQHARLLVVPRVDLDEIQRQRQLVVRIRSKIIRLLQPRALTQHAEPAKNARQTAALTRRRQLHIRRPLVNARLEVVEDAALTKHAVTRAREARLHGNQLHVVNGEALVLRSLIQRRRHTKYADVARVLDLHADMMHQLRRAPTALIRSAARPSRPRPELLAIQRHRRRLAIPCIQRDEVQIDAKHVVRHGQEVECPLKVHALPAVLIAAQDRAEAAAHHHHIHRRRAVVCYPPGSGLPERTEVSHTQRLHPDVVHGKAFIIGAWPLALEVSMCGRSQVERETHLSPAWSSRGPRESQPNG